MPAAKGLGGSRDVGDAVHGGGRGARGRGHEDGQVWHLGQVDDAWREKREGCQDKLLQLSRAGAGSASLTQPPSPALLPKAWAVPWWQDLLHS